MPIQVVVAEGDLLLADSLTRRLRAAGFEINAVADGDAALAAIRRRRPELVIADVDLPGVDGLDLCKQLRSQADTSGIGVIILSSRTDVVDRIIGFELGADDYLVKPIDAREVVARMRSVLRRLRQPPPPPSRVAGLEIDRGAHTVAVDGEPVKLTGREFALLSAVMGANGRVVRRTTLLEQAWGVEHGDELASRTLDSHVARLRHKLGVHARRLITVKGIGYRFDVSERPPEDRLPSPPGTQS